MLLGANLLSIFVPSYFLTITYQFLCHDKLYLIKFHHLIKIRDKFISFILVFLE